MTEHNEEEHWNLFAHQGKEKEPINIAVDEVLNTIAIRMKEG